MGKASAPGAGQNRKTGTVPDCGRLLAGRVLSQIFRTNPPETVLRLVQRFDRDRAVFLSGDYKEEQLRAEFLNPFFESLGWDVYNRQGLSETYKPVTHEESIKVAGASKAPDYTFRIGGH